MIEDRKLQAFFREEPLVKLGKERHATYVNAKPFPHIVMDDFFPAELVEQVLEGVEHPTERWQQFDNPQELKRANREPSG